MASVTQRIKMISQPRGGYLNPKRFEEIQLEMAQQLSKAENIHPSLVGLSVDYLTRFSLGTNSADAFKIALLGAGILGDLKQANALLFKIKGLDDTSIINASKMVGYDVVFRAGPSKYKSVSEINPDSKTIENIRILVYRSLDFFQTFGPIVLDGFTFEGAYTHIINTGDGDFVTSYALWDFKVSVSSPTKDHTLQLLIYYLMGVRSIHSEIFKAIKYLGVYNPRLNRIYRINVDSIENNIIDEVSSLVIGY